MIQVYARYKTNERVIISNVVYSNKEILDFLCEKFGDGWARVDELKMQEGVHFSAKNEYFGYDANIKRYADFFPMNTRTNLKPKPKPPEDN